MASSRLRLLIALSAGALSASSPRSAWADESEGARLFREGRALLIAERFAEACPKLEESQRLEPHGGTLLNVAACHERAGRVATAWAEFHDALAAARAEGHADREALARERIRALDPRLPWLTLTVTADVAGEGVRVTFDGAEIGRIAWGKDMPIDPGEHLIVATAPGRVASQRRIVARESEHQIVELSGLAPAPPSGSVEPAEPAPEPPAAPAEPALPSPQAPSGRRWVFEAGIFAAYLNGDLDPAGLDTDPSTVSVTNGTTTASCAAIRCAYALGRQGSLTGGVSLFAGYAAADWLHVGGRVLAGPRLRGGAVFATGPSASLHMWGPLWVGASVFLGSASQSERSGTVKPESGYSLASTDNFSMTASSGPAFGAGFELRAEILHTERGALAIDTQPLFLAGANGSAFLLPLGVSYRWR